MVTDGEYNTVNRKRRAGVLLHPTSLPGDLDNGDLGHQAYRFIEFLHAHGFRVWQMLPLGTTHEDMSPYQCLSSHAGNPLLISIDWLLDKGWLKKNEIVLARKDSNFRLSCLQLAARNFYQLNDESWLGKLDLFTSEHTAWLDDYALFMAIKTRYHNQPWYDWPVPLRQRDQGALDEIKQQMGESIAQTKFEQFVFFTQWHELRDYANQHDVELYGDMPIFVAHDSADVWAQKENFLIDKNGEMQFVAGVPPDAFSDTGQRWGNPLFDWDYMKLSGFSWWKERFTSQLELFDMIRIDHFRGLQATWHIPAQDDTAMNGEWVEVPGRELLAELFSNFNQLPLIAEDLGVITDAVIKLKKDFALPGMKVLQFAFDGNAVNPHLPHRHEASDTVYTGTHDNDTTLGWLSDQTNYDKTFLDDYTGASIKADGQGVLSMIRLALSSVSFLTIVPMQDLLLLGSSARMNTPGTVEGNWRWRFDWSQLQPEIIHKVTHYLTLYQR